MSLNCNSRRPKVSFLDRHETGPRYKRDMVHIKYSLHVLNMDLISDKQNQPKHLVYQSCSRELRKRSESADLAFMFVFVGSRDGPIYTSYCLSYNPLKQNNWTNFGRLGRIFIQNILSVLLWNCKVGFHTKKCVVISINGIDSCLFWYIPMNVIVRWALLLLLF